MAAKHPCLEPGCPVLTERRRCHQHERATDAARGTKQQRGYDSAHDALRTELMPHAYGRRCPSCGDPMQAGQALHLMHNSDRTGYLGIGHKHCNLSDAGKAAHQ